MDLLDWLREDGNTALIKQGRRGVEKESLRVVADGKLARTRHPEALGSALTHPYLTTDYSEALLEFVTPPEASSATTLEFLADLHAFVHQRLGGELLWPASMPCVVNDNAGIPIAQYGTSNLGRMKTVYRRGLGFRYGSAMQAIAGVHFNYSPPIDLWPALCERLGASGPDALRSERLMGLARNYRRLSWLVIYLCGASPALCKSFRPERHPLLTELDAFTWHAPYATSLRMSDIGYRNTTQARLSISLNSPSEFVAGLSAAVSTVEPRYEAIGVVVDGEHRQLNANILQIENEYYTAIRPKPGKGTSDRPITALRRRGVEYVEVRTLDLNPADPVGVNANQLRFLETLLLHCLLTESPPIDAAEHRELDARELETARNGRRPGLELPRGGRNVPLRAWGLEVLDRLYEVAELLDAEDSGRAGYVAAVDAQRDAMQDADATPSARLLDALMSRGESFFEHMLGAARRHHEHFASMRIAPEREAELAAAASESLAEQRCLEADDGETFERFLERYFAHT